ncbi:hypothetical protein CoNPh27_CDS0043 [Staphylococcus phage S-CoN_Ph27]|nr:hypothetical protein CoNPh27_CDS0043 [Staphylococcus phage S-CoN_Ph27]
MIDYETYMYYIYYSNYILLMIKPLFIFFL